MALSRFAQEFAAEISKHDWSDAPWRADRAGHDRSADSPNKINDEHVLDVEETDTVRMNVMWVAAQVLGHADRNFDVYEFAEACGVKTTTSYGRRNGGIESGVRMREGRYCRPGTWDTDKE
jgi:hypothetical protein